MNVYRSAQFCFGPACASLVLTQWSMKKWYMLIFLKLSENMMTGKWIRNLWLKLPTFYQHSYPGQLQPTQFYSCTLLALISGPLYMTQLNRLKLKCYCTILTDWQKKKKNHTRFLFLLSENVFRFGVYFRIFDFNCQCSTNQAILDNCKRQNSPTF